MFHALSTVLDKCKSFSELKQIHALLITFGLGHDDLISSKLLCFAALSGTGNMDYAYRVFSRLPTPRVFDWNTIIRGYAGSKNPNKSFSVFIKMLRSGAFPDYLTYPFLAKASARLLKPQLGCAIHGHALKNGFELDKFISNSLIHMYASCRDIAYARRVFDGMTVKNVVSWNAMLDGYAKCGDMALARQIFDLMPQRDVVSWSCLIDGHVKSGDYKEALAVFEDMRVSGPKANEVTMVSVLCACSHLGALDQGRLMHCYVTDNGLPITLVLRTSLVDMYAKCGAIGEALNVFRRGVSSGQTDVLLWNAMIGGFATHGLVKESLELFTEMQIVGIVPDEITFLCLLSACAHGGLVEEAWYFFECLGKHSMTPKSEHYACLVDVLARAGQVAEAYQFLCEMPMEPTASLLGALLNGCLIHGKSDLAEIVGRRLIELDPDHDGRYIGLSNVFAAVKRWKEARTMREAMERRGVKKSAGFSCVEISGALCSFIAHDETHPNSEQIYNAMSKWMGESEKLVSNLFQMARDSAPSIIFIDEIDSLCGQRGEGNESEASRRIKTELLVQMQGVGHNDQKVLVLAATNTPYALDQAIRRRFDKRIYIPLPDLKARQHMFKVHLGDTPHNLTESDFENLARRTEGFSGSDISVCVKDVLFEPVRKTQDAMFFFKTPNDMWIPCGPKQTGAVQITMQELAAKGLAAQILPPPISRSDFDKVLARQRPTVSKADLQVHERFTNEFGEEG